VHTVLRIAAQVLAESRESDVVLLEESHFPGDDVEVGLPLGALGGRGGLGRRRRRAEDPVQGALAIVVTCVAVPLHVGLRSRALTRLQLALQVGRGKQLLSARKTLSTFVKRKSSI